MLAMMMIKKMMMMMMLTTEGMKTKINTNTNISSKWIFSYQTTLFVFSDAGHMTKVHRENLLLKACTVSPSFNYLNDTDKLVFLLSNCDIIFFSAKTCSKMLNIRTDVSRTDFI